MNIEGLLSVASKVGTPLALAGIIVIVLYALYKQVLALKLFAPIEAGPTARLLENVLDKLFWLALIALILGVAAYVVTSRFPQGISREEFTSYSKELEEMRRESKRQDTALNEFKANVQEVKENVQEVLHSNKFISKAPEADDSLRSVDALIGRLPQLESHIDELHDKRKYMESEVSKALTMSDFPRVDALISQIYQFHIKIEKLRLESEDIVREIDSRIKKYVKENPDIGPFKNNYQ